MKNRIWIALLLAVVLAIPALAQQTSQNPPAQGQSDQTQAPAQSQQNTTDQTQQQTQQPTEQTQQPAQQQPAQPAAQGQEQGTSARQPLQPETHEGFWGHLNPFARKKYVQRQMTPIRDRVNELDQLTATNSKDIKDVDSRAQDGIRQASARADQADQHAMQAGQTAQQAHQVAQDASTRLTSVQQVVSNIDQYKPTTETEIRFRPGQSVLSKKAKDALDEMATPLANQRGYIIEVQGFSPGRGAAAVQDSQALAQSVVRYLVIQHNVPVYRIYVLGMGNARVASASATAETGKPGRAVSGRRVEVALLKNDLEQLQAQPSGTPGATPGATSGGVTGTTAQPTTQPAQPPATAQPSAPAGQQTPPPQGQQQTPPPAQSNIPPR